MKLKTAILNGATLSLLITIIVSGCATPQQTKRTRVYSGPGRQNSEVAIILNQNNRDGWSGVLHKVDGIKVKMGADVLPGSHQFTIAAGNFGEAVKKAAAEERRKIAAGEAPAAPAVGQSKPGEQTVYLTLDAVGAVLISQRNATERNVTFTVQAGKTYIVRCDSSSGGSLRIEETTGPMAQ